MISVDFQLDEACLADDLQHSPETASSAALEETYFVMPVRFCVNGVELFEQPGEKRRSMIVVGAESGPQRVELPNDKGYWLPLPVLGFATHMLQALDQAKQEGMRKLYLAGGGYLVLSRHGELLSIKTSINENCASMEFSEALKAFRAFHEKVRQFLAWRVPKLQQHGSWKQWFS